MGGKDNMRNLSWLTTSLIVVLFLFSSTAVKAADDITVKISGNTATITAKLNDGSKTTTDVVLKNRIVGWSVGPKCELDMVWNTTNTNYFSAGGRLWRAYGPGVAGKPRRMTFQLYYLEDCNGVKIPFGLAECGCMLGVDPDKLPVKN